MPIALRGFGCSGSWMLGVLRETHSPGLSWKLIEEMTSRESNRLRAEKGAGIPTRKDFYDFYGETHVPNLNPQFPMTWRRFLDVVGSKVRRRDRAVCGKVQLASFATIVRDQVIRCIDVAKQSRERAAAEFLRQKTDMDWSSPPSRDAMTQMARVVEDATKNILLYIAIEQQSSVTNDIPSDRCDRCPMDRRNDFRNDTPTEGDCALRGCNESVSTQNTARRNVK